MKHGTAIKFMVILNWEEMFFFCAKYCAIVQTMLVYDVQFEENFLMCEFITKNATTKSNQIAYAIE